MYSEYLKNVQATGHNINSGAYLFPKITIESNLTLTINWYKKVDNLAVQNQLKQIVQSHSDLNTGITLHSMRRGGSFFRVFESHQRKFNFRELMAWCRWEDAKTCCEYLITRDISDGIDPRNLMRIQTVNNYAIQFAESGSNVNVKREPKSDCYCTSPPISQH